MLNEIYSVLLVQWQPLNVILGNVTIQLYCSFFKISKARSGFLQSANQGICLVIVINWFVLSDSLGPKEITLSDATTVYYKLEWTVKVRVTVK